MIKFPEKPRVRNKPIHHALLWLTIALLFLIITVLGYHYLFSHLLR